MTFDEKLALSLAFDEDRDSARFFAGRERELGIFEQTLGEAGTRPQAAFRIFQGAPGAGKSALLHRLGELYGDDALFVRLRNDHLVDRERLAERIARTAFERASGTEKAAGLALEAVGGFLRMGAAADRLAGYLTDAKVERLVLCLDEAQTVDESCAPGLRDLHVDGLGKPTVVVLVGLSHTADNVKNLGGLSRLSKRAAVDVRGMAPEECGESTRAMLDALDADGSRSEAADFVARISLGWPQHLKCAQSALCEELLRIGGHLGRADFGRVSRETDEARFAYYRGRLSNSALGARPAFTAAVVAETMRRETVDALDLEEICENGLAGLRPRYRSLADVSGADFARLLVEKGVLSNAEGGGYEVSIPSMADWLGAQARARRTGRDGPCLGR